MSATLDRVKRILVVSYDEESVEVVRSVVSYLGDGVSVERAGNLSGASGLLDHHFDVVIVVTTGYMRLEHYGTLVLLVKSLSGKGSTVFVTGPLGDHQFVAEMSAAGAEKVIDTGYDVATLLEALAEKLPAATCGG